MKYQLLTEWVETGRSPWTLGTCHKYAKRAIERKPGFAHLPFVQFRKRGRLIKSSSLTMSHDLVSSVIATWERKHGSTRNLPY